MVQTATGHFSGVYKELEPAFSPDGLKLFYASKRPLLKGDSIEKKDYDIWYVRRTTLKSEWSDPVNVGLKINTDGNEYYPSIASSGNLYFTAEREDTKGREDIYVSILANNEYSVPQNLDSAINTEFYEFNAYISPDESLIVFSSFGRNDGMGGGDLYFSFKNKNDEWGEVTNMGNLINSPQLDYCPFIDYNNKKFYFSSERNHVNYQEGNFKNIDEILKRMNQVDNGMCRIYVIDIINTALPMN